ncbi:hypothetical protein [Sharpea azabuensis]|uniref:hypothetical protein n=1 Tax=Sharpea azabuensis TaxID=322505 RepID=UPI0015691A26|nr:hypothetical protein [Sharpea azabuensis]
MKYKTCQILFFTTVLPMIYYGCGGLIISLILTHINVATLTNALYTAFLEGACVVSQFQLDDSAELSTVHTVFQLFQDLYFNTPAVVSYHRCQLPATEGAVSEVVQYAKSFHQVHTRYTLNTLLSISYHKFPVIFPCGSVLQPFTTHNGFQTSSFQ